MAEFSLLRDFALIMVVSGAAVILLRKLRQPPVLGYLLAGVLISPYILHFPTVTDTHTIGLLADIGLVLLLFGVGLEFGWSKVRQIGMAVLIISAIEIATMISLGYGLGRVLGWSRTDALILGAALQASSSAIIVKVLKDLGRLNMVSTRVVVGILIVEDFAAVLIIALISGIGTTDTGAGHELIFLAVKMVIFAASTLVLGTLIIPRIINFIWKLHSKETLLISALGLSFALALLSKELGLSVASGAFLMGALVGDTKHADDVIEIMTPVRDMFAALFFVTIGMLIDVSKFREFLVPAVIVTLIFVVGKVVSNTIGAMISGYGASTSLQIGMSMPQMGEFSLAVAKVGLDQGIATAPLYPVITVATALSSAIAPVLTRSTDAIGDFISRKSPGALKQYLIGISEWILTVREHSAERRKQSVIMQQSIRRVLINLLIILIISGIGTFLIQYVETLARHFPARRDIVALVLGLVIILLCLPSMILIWRSVRTIIDETIAHALMHSKRNQRWNTDVTRGILRNSMMVIMTLLMSIWLIPFISQLLAIGSFALAIPLLLLVIALFLLTSSVWRVHHRLEQAFDRVFLGEASGDHSNTPPAAENEIISTTNNHSSKIKDRKSDAEDNQKHRLNPSDGKSKIS